MQRFFQLFVVLVSCFFIFFSLSVNAAGVVSLVRVVAPAVYSARVVAGKTVIKEASVYTVSQAGINRKLVASNVYPIAPSTSSKIVSSLVGLGVGVASVFASPAVGLALAVLSVGMVGYDLYQALKSNNLTADPVTGVFNYQGLPHAGAYCLSYASCKLLTGFASPVDAAFSVSASASPVVAWPSGGPDYWYSTYQQAGNPALTYILIYPNSNVPSVPGVVAPITQAEMATAFLAAVNSSPAVAADAVNFAIANGVDPLPFLPSNLPASPRQPAVITLPDGTVVSIEGGATVSDPYVSTISVPGSAPVVSVLSSPGSVASSSLASPVTSPALPAFPTDYNREATQLEIRDSLSTGSLTDAVSLSDSQILSSLTAQANDQQVDVLNQLSGSSLPTSPQFFHPQLTKKLCSPIGYNWNGHSVVFDLCPYEPVINRIGSYTLFVMTLAYIFSSLMRFKSRS